jgi:hypothetical protein
MRRTTSVTVPTYRGHPGARCVPTVIMPEEPDRRGPGRGAPRRHHLLRLLGSVNVADWLRDLGFELLDALRTDYLTGYSIDPVLFPYRSFMTPSCPIDPRGFP